MDLLRGEIAKLRDEIQATKRKEKENREPIMKVDVVNKSKRTEPNTETLKAIRKDIKVRDYCAVKIMKNLKIVITYPVFPHCIYV